MIGPRSMIKRHPADTLRSAGCLFALAVTGGRSRDVVRRSRRTEVFALMVVVLPHQASYRSRLCWCGLTCKIKKEGYYDHRAPVG